MPRKIELLWDSNQKIWFKYYIDPNTNKRKKLYLGRAKSRTNDPEAYNKALDKWNLFRLNAFGEELTPVAKAKLTKRRLSESNPERNKHPKDSIAYAAHLYLERHTIKQYKAGQITHHTYKLRKQSIRYVCDHFFKSPATNQGKLTGYGIHKEFTDLKMVRLFEFFQHRVFVSKTLSYATARTRHGAFKAFVNWCWENHFIDTLPRNLFSADLRLKKPKSKNGIVHKNKPILISFDELEQFFATASTLGTKHPLMLYLLLELNTGMAHIDVGTLRFNEITFDDQGNPTHIERARSKTGTMAKWKLWDTTSKLLKDHIEIRQKYNDYTDDPLIPREPFVFLQIDPNHRRMFPHPIMYSIQADSPKHYKQAMTLTALLMRVKKHTPNWDKKPKHLRSTAATHIRAISNNNLILTQMFLAHSAKTIAEMHYAQTINFDDLFRYIDVMYVEMGIDKLEKYIFQGHNNYKEKWSWL